MKNIWPPQDQILWSSERQGVMPCRKDIHVEVAIVGGGMAGLSAAQEFARQGKKVALFEQYECGSGATGKSSGFVIQNAELSFTDFSKRYNFEVACKIWDFIHSGVEDVRNNIVKNNFDCGYTAQNALMVASDKGALKSFRVEHENLKKGGYGSRLHDQDGLAQMVDGKGYFGALEYEHTLGMNAYRYCQEMKKLLVSQGVLIFEETPVTKIDDHYLTTAHARITADYIVVCVDRFLPDLGVLSQDVYHAQNFILASQRLTDEQVSKMFVEASFMVWDSELLYNYFRLTSDRRLVLGGSDLWSTYAATPSRQYDHVIKKIVGTFSRHFPQMKLEFEYVWSGMIGLSKDIGPIAGADKDFKHVYYIAASAGLPIAAALGRYSAEHLLNGRADLDEYFSPYRKFPIGGILQKILGTKLTFALSNGIKQNIP